LPSGNWTLLQIGTVVNAIGGNTTSTIISGLVPGSYVFTVTNSLGCVSPASVNVNIPAQPIQPDAGIDGATTICETSSTPIELFFLIAGEQAGGTWTRLAGSGGIFNAIAGTYTPTPGATSSVFEYRIVGVAPCVDDSSLVNVIINAQPNAGIDGCISVSDESTNVIDLFSLIIGEQAGGLWTQTSGTGGAFSAINGTYTPSLGATTSTFSYTINAFAPCVNDESIATVIVNGPPIGQAVSLFCDSANSTVNSLAFDWNNVGQTSFNFSYSINGDPVISGNTTISNYQVLNLTPNSSVTFTVQPVGTNCFPSSTTTCNLLSNAVFESEVGAYYPNPFHDIVNFKFAEPVKSIKITNVLGQYVFFNDSNEKELQINLAHLSDGTYFVQASTANSIKTFKIVKN
jgi:Secretion system C-terminal sorting domain